MTREDVHELVALGLTADQLSIVLSMLFDLQLQVDMLEKRRASDRARQAKRRQKPSASRDTAPVADDDEAEWEQCWQALKARLLAPHEGLPRI